MQIWGTSNSFNVFTVAVIFKLFAFKTATVVGAYRFRCSVVGAVFCLKFYYGPRVRVFKNLCGWPFAKTVDSN